MQTETRTAQVPTIPGTPFDGGFYVGRLRVADKVHALIVSPKAEGETTGKWQCTATDLAGATSFFDGQANTEAMALWASPFALWAKTLQISGFTDWYLPSRDELELLYRHLKPTDEGNYTYRSGENPSALPPTWPYTKQSPAQTSAPAFCEDGAETFAADWYWSSTQYSRVYAWTQIFDGGYQGSSGKSYEGRARAVRRLVIE